MLPVHVILYETRLISQITPVWRNAPPDLVHRYWSTMHVLVLPAIVISNVSWCARLTLIHSYLSLLFPMYYDLLLLCNIVISNVPWCLHLSILTCPWYFQCTMMCLSYPLLLSWMYRDAHVLLLSTLTCPWYFQCTIMCFSYTILYFKCTVTCFSYLPLLFSMYHDVLLLPNIVISNVPWHASLTSACYLHVQWCISLTCACFACISCFWRVTLSSSSSAKSVITRASRNLKSFNSTFIDWHEALHCSSCDVSSTTWLAQAFYKKHKYALNILKAINAIDVLNNLLTFTYFEHQMGNFKTSPSRSYMSQVQVGLVLGEQTIIDRNVADQYILHASKL